MKQFLGGLLIIALAAGIPATLQASEKSNPSSEIGKLRKEGIDVVQGRLFRKTFRHEFTASGGVIPNNTFLMYELAQFQYTFHFRETLAFEATYGRAFNQEKDIVDDLEDIPCPSPPEFFDAAGNPATDCGVTLENPPDPLQNLYFGNIIWSPLYGKFAIFSKKIFHFDIFFLAGAGMFQNENSNRFAFNVGGGFKVFLNDWSAFRFEFRNITVREGAPFSHIVNNRLFSLGYSVFLPTKNL